MAKKVEVIISKAKKRFPCTYEYTGFLNAEDLKELRCFCKVSVPSVFVQGSGTYYIRYRR